VEEVRLAIPGLGGGTVNDDLRNSTDVRDNRLISVLAISIAVGEVYEIPLAGGVPNGEEIFGSLSLFSIKGGGTLDRGEARLALAGLGG
jgi:hypothetical protein